MIELLAKPKGDEMDKLLPWLGRIAGVGGALVCAVAVALRLSGKHWIAGYESITLMQAGVAAMVFACLCFLASLSNNSNGRH
jgi:hypothetical protein